MYSIASESTEAVSVFPKGDTNCWSAVILSPIFSFLTLKGGKGDVDGVSLRDLLFDPSLLLFLVTLSESRTSDLFLGFSSKVGGEKKELDWTSFMDADVAFHNGTALLENCNGLFCCWFGGEFLMY